MTDIRDGFKFKSVLKRLRQNKYPRRTPLNIIISKINKSHKGKVSIKIKSNYYPKTVKEKVLAKDIDFGEWMTNYQALMRGDCHPKRAFIKKGQTVWTYELIKNKALKYNFKIDFIKNDLAAYNAARSRKILNKVCSHMKSKLKYLFNINKKTYIKKINQLGKKSKIKFQFYKFEKYIGRPSHVLLYSKGRKNIKIYLPALLKGQNPYATSSDSENRLLHPKIIKILKINKIKFIHDKNIAIGLRPDFVIQVGNKQIILEAKTERSLYAQSTSSKLQYEKYSNFIKTHSAFHQLIIVSEKGKYGFSLKQLDLFLKNNC